MGSNPTGATRFMKKLLTFLSFLLLSVFLALGQNDTVSLAWNAPNDASVTGYHIYFKEAVMSNYTVYPVNGATNTMVKIPGILPYVLYEAYATSMGDGTNESDPSGKIRYECFYAYGDPNATFVHVDDLVPANFPMFVTNTLPSFGTVNGVPPTLTYIPTSQFTNNDLFSYKSPETFGAAGTNVICFYRVIKVPTNSPPIIYNK